MLAVLGNLQRAAAGMFEILFQNDDLVAIHKPSGIKVHRGACDSRRGRYVLQELRDQIGARLYPVHRLDRATSGVLVFALSPGAARSLNRAFARQNVTKVYLAVVRGYIAESGEVAVPLTRDEPAVDRERAPQPALTRFTRLDTVELPLPVGRYATCRYSLVQAVPHTGRTHQIRRHLRHLAHPILGDRRYGDNKHNRFLQEHLKCARLLLAATELTLPLPGSQKPLKLVAGLDQAFAAVLQRLGWISAVPRTWWPQVGKEVSAGFSGALPDKACCTARPSASMS